MKTVTHTEFLTNASAHMTGDFEPFQVLNSKGVPALTISGQPGDKTRTFEGTVIERTIRTRFGELPFYELAEGLAATYDRNWFEGLVGKRVRVTVEVID